MQICSVPPALVEQLSERSQRCSQYGLAAFEMFPCLYLTKEEGSGFDGDFQGCLESFLRGENHRWKASPGQQSCLPADEPQWFCSWEALTSSLLGHGGEDLELIDRLTRHYPIGPSSWMTMPSTSKPSIREIIRAFAASSATMPSPPVCRSLPGASMASAPLTHPCIASDGRAMISCWNRCCHAARLSEAPEGARWFCNDLQWRAAGLSGSG